MACFISCRSPYKFAVRKSFSITVGTTVCNVPSRISLVLLAAFVGGLVIKFVKDQASHLAVNIEETLDATGVLDRVVTDMAEMMKEKNNTANTEAEYNIMIQRRNEMEQAMSQCVYGIDKHKIRVKEMIQSSLFYHGNTPIRMP